MVGKNMVTVMAVLDRRNYDKLKLQKEETGVGISTFIRGLVRQWSKREEAKKNE